MLPVVSTRAPRGMVTTVDQLATGSGLAVLRDGGTAVDAAIATNAVLTVTSPHLCGLGGDLFALVHPSLGPPAALNASGRAGSGADLDRLRADGHDRMPFRGDVRSVTVPGCVDGWQALHDHFGRLPLRHVLADAIRLADEGFPASPLLEATAALMADVPGADPGIRDAVTGGLVRRPGTAAALRAIAADGRDGFYLGPFGTGLRDLGGGEFSGDDLARVQADWVEPLGLEALGHRLWTIPPNSQGYLALAGAAVADELDLPGPADEPAVVHLLAEAAAAVGHDRPSVLHELADGAALLGRRRLGAAAASVVGDRTVPRPVPTSAGDTTYLATADGDGTAVSLIQSNAADFGAHVVEPTTGTFLHNRGIGFSVDPDHPAAYGPGRRPPHTLSPLAVSRSDGSLRAVLGTMGGDAQPQVLLQLVVRLLTDHQDAAAAVAAPRWILADRTGDGFATWSGDRAVVVEHGAPSGWATALEARGHEVQHAAGVGGRFGHAQVIERADGVWIGATDPRALIGAAAGW